MQKKSTVTCAQCGVSFLAWPSDIRNGRGKHCSRDCATAHKKTPLTLPVERFMAKILCDTETGCWMWTGSRIRFGYGSFMVGRRTGTTSRAQLAHRVSWAMTYGPIPDGMLVLHRCDTPSCVRPGHLFLGDQQDNMGDMWSKGRANPRGIRQK